MSEERASGGFSAMAPADARRGLRPISSLVWGGLALLLVGVALRLNNAIRYPPRWGLDALMNERYVGRLLESWSLPAPDSGWSTAHPPLFYYLSAALGRTLGIEDSLGIVVPTRLVSTAFGLGMVVLVVWLVRRADPGNPRRAFFAGALVLFLPVHIYMSAMLSEEILAASLASLAVIAACVPPGGAARPGQIRWARELGIGIAAGLALLTKLTGVLAIAAVVGGYLLSGLRAGRLAEAARRAAIVGGVALVVGGWFYARNLALYGYLYPQDLESHAVMFSMPPGERHVRDYFYVPLSTFTDPQVLSPDLLLSVWGTTYVTLWYEGHGHFLPEGEPRVTRVGSVVLALALVPALAFGIGTFQAFRGQLRRSLAPKREPEGTLLLLVALTLAGYVGFTLSNPWFATVKGSYLLGMTVPFAYFASGVLAEWTAPERSRAALLCVWLLLAMLLFGVCLSFTHGIGVWNLTPPGDLPGLQWKPVSQ